MSRRLVLTTAIIIALLTAAGLQANAQADVVYGCYQKNHGQLRVVGSPGECLKSENAIIIGYSLDDQGTLAGEHCWSYSGSTDTTPVVATLRLGFSYIGNDHYLCSGIFSAAGGAVNMEFPAYGNAELANGKIIVTLSLAGLRVESANVIKMGNDMYKMELDANLIGAVKGIGVYRGNQPPIAITELTVGAVSPMACP